MNVPTGDLGCGHKGHHEEGAQHATQCQGSHQTGENQSRMQA